MNYLYRALFPSSHSAVKFLLRQKPIPNTSRYLVTSNPQNGILREIFLSLRMMWYRKRPRLVGVDEAGNRYFEAPPNKGSQHFNKSRLPKRFVLAPNQRHLEERGTQDSLSISPEWASWLRHRRTEPPTNDEIIANEQAAQKRRMMGAQIDVQRESERQEMIRQGLLHDNNSTVSGFKQKVAFPVYKDMECTPGEATDNSIGYTNSETK